MSEEKKAKKEILRKPSEKRKEMGMIVKAKKKRGSARAVIKKGTGIVRINKRNLKIFSPKYVKLFVEEPLKKAGSLSNEIDIDVNVMGSGFMSQAVAARGAIAKALVQYSGDKKLREDFMKYDRMLLVDDVRRTEPKKPLGTKARAKKQKSKR